METKENAVAFWDTQWKTEKGQKAWETPEESVAGMISTYKNTGVRSVLDLGSGIGRHAMLFAREGFKVTALDGSREGITFLEAAAATEGLAIKCLTQDIDRLDFPDNSFDLVISWNVIYHGTRDFLAQVAEDVYRICSPGGYFQGTLLSKSNHYFGQGTEVAPDTWVADGGSDKAHPHCYLDKDDARRLFKKWEIIRLEELDFRNYAKAYHWHFIVRK
ncbi:MAG: class I SAM-dependent methyltransferase [Spirochaetales bacterium]|nr:class I SAM-dependent methyltransferase [Spirochaetales bacterium]